MKAIHLSFYQKPDSPNFGDDLSPALVEYVTGISALHADFANAELVAVGSLLGYWDSRRKAILRTARDIIKARRPVAFWGTGLIRPKRVYLPRCEVLALRGPLSQRHAGLAGKRILLADPGILARRLVPPSDKNNRIGVVLHYVDKAHPLVQELKQDDRFLVIDVERPCREVCKQISACIGVLSSSLHGLVVADSYGIPNARLVLSDRIIGGEFKFSDYSLGIERGSIPTFAPTTTDEIRMVPDVLLRDKPMAEPELISFKENRLIEALENWLEGRRQAPPSRHIHY